MTPAGERRRTRLPVAVVVAAVLMAPAVAAVAGFGPAPVHAQASGEQRYRPPVDAPVVDPFRPPSVPWGPGNRGLEYATDAGTPIRAVGPGAVTFAGPVAGTLHVTIAHPDGLRSSYSGVAAVRVSVGDVVDGGHVVAVSAISLHLGVRDGDRYIDPAGLWGLPVASGPVVLVPIEDVPPPAPGPRRSSPTSAGAAFRRVLARLPLGPWVG